MKRVILAAVVALATASVADARILSVTPLDGGGPQAAIDNLFRSQTLDGKTFACTAKAMPGAIRIETSAPGKLTWWTIYTDLDPVAYRTWSPAVGQKATCTFDMNVSDWPMVSAGN